MILPWRYCKLHANKGIQGPLLQRPNALQVKNTRFDPVESTAMNFGGPFETGLMLRRASCDLDPESSSIPPSTPGFQKFLNKESRSICDERGILDPLGSKSFVHDHQLVYYSSKLSLRKTSSFEKITYKKHEKGDRISKKMNFRWWAAALVWLLALTHHFAHHLENQPNSREDSHSHALSDRKLPLLAEIHKFKLVLKLKILFWIKKKVNGTGWYWTDPTISPRACL